jgi:hypothetical protein
VRREALDTVIEAVSLVVASDSDAIAAARRRQLQIAREAAGTEFETVGTRSSAWWARQVR